MVDGGLRAMFRKNMPGAQWTSIETGTTTQGVPDAEYAFDKVQGWVEFKRTSGWAVVISPEQVGWLLRRSRLNCRCFVAIRRVNHLADELWIIHGNQASLLRTDGLQAVVPLVMMPGGPSKWNWKKVEEILKA